jgi:hypothetical protein
LVEGGGFVFVGKLSNCQIVTCFVVRGFNFKRTAESVDSFFAVAEI